MEMLVLHETASALTLLPRRTVEDTDPEKLAAELISRLDSNAISKLAKALMRFVVTDQVVKLDEGLEKAINDRVINRLLKLVWMEHTNPDRYDEECQKDRRRILIAMYTLDAMLA